MKVYFRTDSSAQIGTGHVMRCITLAEALRSRGEECSFICRNLEGNLIGFIRQLGFEVYVLDFKSIKDLKVRERSLSITNSKEHELWLGCSWKEDVEEVKTILEGKVIDWLVVDHYGLDEKWEEALNSYYRKLMVIDDLADRVHICDAFLDQNIHENPSARYTELLPSYCKKFLGPKHVLLRSEFHEQKKTVQARSGEIKNLLVYYGGIDAENNTTIAIKTLKKLSRSSVLNSRVKVNVVISAQHIARATIEKICREESYLCHVQTSQMARLMKEADLAVGAGGISTYERLYLLLPSILKATAFNQLEPLTYMDSIGFIELYKSNDELEDKLAAALGRKNISPPDILDDGRKGIVSHLIDSFVALCEISRFDLRRTYYWINENPQLRRDFLIERIPDIASHFAYWRKLLTDPLQHVVAIYHFDKHVGNCGLKNIGLGARSCEVWIYIGDVSARGKGVASRSITLLLSIAKTKYRCNKVYLHVKRSNLVAIALYESIGFFAVDATLQEPWVNCEEKIRRMERSL